MEYISAFYIFAWSFFKVCKDLKVAIPLLIKEMAGYIPTFSESYFRQTPYLVARVKVFLLWKRWT